MPANTVGEAIAIKDCLVYHLSDGGGLGTGAYMRVYTMEGEYVKSVFENVLNWPTSFDSVTAMEWHPGQRVFIIATHARPRYQNIWSYDPELNARNLNRISECYFSLLSSCFLLPRAHMKKQR